MVLTADEIQTEAEKKMQKAVASIQTEMGTIRTGRANPMILDRVQVEYYGTPTPVRQVANVSIQDGQTIIIQPYDKAQLGEIEKALSKSDIGLPVNNDGQVLRLNVPPLNEDRRHELAKQVKKVGEEGKVALRNIRREAIDEIGHIKNLPEDETKRREEAVQKLIDKYTGQLDKLVADKEKEVREV